MQSYNPRTARRPGLGSSPFARHYSGNHYCFLFLPVLRCFSSRGWLPACTRWYIFNISGCPIRKSKDVTLVCNSPWLIAAYHVLLRLSDPRHSPCALNCFKKFISYDLAYNHNPSCNWFCFPNMSKSLYKYEVRCTKYEYLQMFRLWTYRPLPTSMCLKELFFLTLSLLLNVEDIGVEPMTLCVQGRCSSQLS